MHETKKIVKRDVDKTEEKAQNTTDRHCRKSAENRFVTVRRSNFDSKSFSLKEEK